MHLAFLIDPRAWPVVLPSRHCRRASRSLRSYTPLVRVADRTLMPGSESESEATRQPQGTRLPTRTHGPCCMSTRPCPPPHHVSLTTYTGPRPGDAETPTEGGGQKVGSGKALPMRATDANLGRLIRWRLLSPLLGISPSSIRRFSRTPS